LEYTDNISRVLDSRRSRDRPAVPNAPTSTRLADWLASKAYLVSIRHDDTMLQKSPQWWVGVFALAIAAWLMFGCCRLRESAEENSESERVLEGVQNARIKRLPSWVDVGMQMAGCSQVVVDLRSQSRVRRVSISRMSR
jgi:hypothetical protein